MSTSHSASVSHLFIAITSCNIYLYRTSYNSEIGISYRIGSRHCQLNLSGGTYRLAYSTSSARVYKILIVIDRQTNRICYTFRSILIRRFLEKKKKSPLKKRGKKFVESTREKKKKRLVFEKIFHFGRPTVAVDTTRLAAVIGNTRWKNSCGDGTTAKDRSDGSDASRARAAASRGNDTTTGCDCTRAVDKSRVIDCHQSVYTPYL